MYRRFKTTIALTLAAFYALVASCGHGLHNHGSSCSTSCCQVSACSQVRACCSDTSTNSDDQPTCCNRDHFAEVRAELAQVGDSKSCQANTGTANTGTANTGTASTGPASTGQVHASHSHISNCKESHQAKDYRLHQIFSDCNTLSVDDCIACQLLSQLEAGFAKLELHDAVWHKIAQPPLLNESQLAEPFYCSFDARGPPIRI